ncbi:MAG: hypothetical protein ACRCXZ_00200 [Patescibacteria group bacterium]
MNVEDIQKMLNGELSWEDLNNQKPAVEKQVDDFEAFAMEMLGANNQPAQPKQTASPNQQAQTSSLSQTTIDPFNDLEAQMMNGFGTKQDPPITKAPETKSTHQVQVNHTGIDVFAQLELEAQKPSVPTSAAPKPKTPNTPNPVVLPTALENLEKIHKAELEKSRLIEVEKQRLKDLKDTAELNRVREMIRNEERDRYAIIDEERGWVDEAALNVANGIIDSINNANPKIRNYIAQNYGIQQNFIGKLDQNRVSRLFQTPIARVKFYIELLQNEIPTK